MPDRATWYFCRNVKCKFWRGQFVAGPEEKLTCPKCYGPLVRQEVPPKGEKIAKQ